MGDDPGPAPACGGPVRRDDQAAFAGLVGGTHLRDGPVDLWAFAQAVAGFLRRQE